MSILTKSQQQIFFSCCSFHDNSMNMHCKWLTPFWASHSLPSRVKGSPVMHFMTLKTLTSSHQTSMNMCLFSHWSSILFLTTEKRHTFKYLMCNYVFTGLSIIVCWFISALCRTSVIWTFGPTNRNILISTSTLLWFPSYLVIIFPLIHNWWT